MSCFNIWNDDWYSTLSGIQQSVSIPKVQEMILTTRTALFLPAHSRVWLFLSVLLNVINHVNALPVLHSNKKPASNFVSLKDDLSLLSSVPGRCCQVRSAILHDNTFSPTFHCDKITHVKSSPRTTRLYMKWFKDLTTSLFLDGGAYDAGVDYSQLDHPGPELASAALSGQILSRSVRDPSLQLATFAGGCFWGLELAYQRHVGVLHTMVGYTGGMKQEPSYDAVSTGSTGHREAVVVYYDPNQTTYEQLVDLFLSRVDVTTMNGQGNDIGSQYCTAIYCHTEEQKMVAQQKMTEILRLLSSSSAERKDVRIATELCDAQIFWPAEKYHQQYLERGGRTGVPQSAEKGNTDTIRCYG